VYSHNYTFK